MKTFEFPLNAKNGTLGMVADDHAAQQVVKAIASTRPGELPLSRDYGVWVDYNIPHELAKAVESDVVAAIERWYPSIGIRSVQINFDDEGRHGSISVDLGLVKEQ